MRQYRFLNGEMTQEEFGRRLGISRQAVSDIENGRSTPSLILAHKIATEFKTTIDELFFPKADVAER